MVDNGSSDHTAVVARRYGQQLQLVYVAAPEPGLHVGRHAGMRQARSRILMFADDDIEAEPTWVDAVTGAFRDPAVVLVGGNNLPRFESAPPPWLLELWQAGEGNRRMVGHLSVSHLGEGSFEIDAEDVWGCNFSIRREALLEAGGFHPDAMPTDLLRYRGDGETHISRWINAAGKKVLFASLASVHHWVPDDRMTPDYFCRRYFAQGISASYSAIRSNRGLLSRRQLLRHQIDFVRYYSRYKTVAWLGGTAGMSKDLALIMASARKAHRAGFRFHQDEAAGSPELMAWILKPDYFSARSGSHG